MPKSFLDKNGLKHLVGKVAKKVHTHTKDQITDFPTSMPASDVHAWAKEENRPTYTAADVGAAPTNHSHNTISYRGIAAAPTGEGCYPVSITTAFSIDGITFPVYAKGMFVASGTNDATLIVTDSSGNTYTAFRVNGIWKYAKKLSVDGHTHSIANVTSLQSTLDGKLTRGSYERIQGTSDSHENLDDYTTHGFYNVKTAYVDNCPSGIGIDATLLVYPWDSSGYEGQEITESAACTTARRWLRHKNGSGWTAWKAIISEDNIGSQSVASATSTKPVTTGGTGAAYTATVSGITALTAGVSFVMVPHTVSTSTTPTLNVNGLGAKGIRRRLSNISTSAQAGYSASWLASGKPYTVVYDGSYWIVEGMAKPAVADLYGTSLFCRVEKGSYTGTGTSGPANPTTINFSFTPKFVIIDGRAGNSEKHTLWAFYGNTYAKQITHATDDCNYAVKTTWSDTTLTMSAGSECCQMNESDCTYDYIAFG